MQRGFTLLELSIVITIVALVAGGLLAGRHIARSAEVRSVIDDAEEWKSASLLFRDRYRAIPGDMRNATALWGRADGGADTSQNCANPVTDTAGQGNPATCNGDGDGTLENALSERFRFWHHLANAGMISGSFTGVKGPNGSPSDTIAGVNVPEAKISGGAWFAMHDPSYTGHLTRFDGQYGNFIYVGRVQFNTSPSAPLFTADEAYGIDAKFDDGKPGLGTVVVESWDACTDATASSDINADYLPVSDEKVCLLMWRKFF